MIDQPMYGFTLNFSNGPSRLDKAKMPGTNYPPGGPHTRMFTCKCHEDSNPRPSTLMRNLLIIPHIYHILLDGRCFSFEVTRGGPFSMGLSLRLVLNVTL